MPLTLISFLWLIIQNCGYACSVVSDSLQPHGLYSLPGSYVHGILPTRTLEWIAIPFSRESSRPKDRTRVSCIPCRFFTVWATREAQLLKTFIQLCTLFSFPSNEIAINPNDCVSVSHNYNFKLFPFCCLLSPHFHCILDCSYFLSS